MRFKYQRIAAMALLCPFLTSCGKGKGAKETTAAPRAVTIQAVQTTGLQQSLFYSGTLEADNIVQLGFAVPGVVNQVAVQEGQRVHAGELLATIDATEYSNALVIANATLAQAEDLFQRLHSLYEKGSLPAKDYIEIKSRVEQARANKNLAAKRLADCRLYAPMPGIITVKAAERGSTAAPGVPAFTLSKTDQVYARITVPESEVGALKQGQEAQVVIGTLQDTLKGKISIINPQADNTTHTYSVKIRLSNGDGRLLPGMLSEVTIGNGRSFDAIVIPAKAVVRDADNITYVFVANEQRTAVRKRITVGRVTGDNAVVVTSGLQHGDQLVIAGQTNLSDGNPLRF